MAVQIQFRRGTEAQWLAGDPVIAEGEFALEIDTGRFKVGDGVRHYTELDYASGVEGPPGEQGPPGATELSPGRPVTVSDTAPVDPVVGHLWLDTGR